MVLRRPRGAPGVSGRAAAVRGLRRFGLVSVASVGIVGWRKRPTRRPRSSAEGVCGRGRRRRIHAEASSALTASDGGLATVKAQLARRRSATALVQLWSPRTPGAAAVPLSTRSWSMSPLGPSAVCARRRRSYDPSSRCLCDAQRASTSAWYASSIHSRFTSPPRGSVRRTRLSGTDAATTQSSAQNAASASPMAAGANARSVSAGSSPASHVVLDQR